MNLGHTRERRIGVPGGVNRVTSHFTIGAFITLTEIERTIIAVTRLAMYLRRVPGRASHSPYPPFIHLSFLSSLPYSSLSFIIHISAFCCSFPLSFPPSSPLSLHLHLPSYLTDSFLLLLTSASQRFTTRVLPSAQAAPTPKHSHP